MVVTKVCQLQVGCIRRTVWFVYLVIHGPPVYEQQLLFLISKIVRQSRLTSPRRYHYGHPTTSEWRFIIVQVVLTASTWQMNAIKNFKMIKMGPTEPSLFIEPRNLIPSRWQKATKTKTRQPKNCQSPSTRFRIRLPPDLACSVGILPLSFAFMKTTGPSEKR